VPQKCPSYSSSSNFFEAVSLEVLSIQR